MSSLFASVIVPTRRPADLRDFVHSLLAQTVLPGELILVDTSDAGDDAIEEFVRALACPDTLQLIYIRMPGAGTVSSRNAALDQAHGDIIFMFDDDIVLDQRHIETILRFYEHDLSGAVVHGIGGIGAMPRYLTDPVQPMRDAVRSLVKAVFGMDGWRKGLVLASGFRTALPHRSGLAPVTWLQGGNCSYRRTALAHERFAPQMELFPYALSEDIEFSHRIAQRHRLYVTDDACVHHKASPGRRLNDHTFFVSFVHNHYYIVRHTVRHPLKYAAFAWAMIGVLLTLLFNLPAAPQRTLRKLRGFGHGLLVIACMELSTTYRAQLYARQPMEPHTTT